MSACVHTHDSIAKIVVVKLNSVHLSGARPARSFTLAATAQTLDLLES